MVKFFKIFSFELLNLLKPLVDIVQPKARIKAQLNAHRHKSRQGESHDKGQENISENSRENNFNPHLVSMTMTCTHYFLK